jgi:hypothetical protein
MLRLVATLSLVLSSVLFVQSAVAVGAADCRFCLDLVTLQTRDGQPWSAGKPVTLVIHVAGNASAPLPVTAQAVVMQTDGDRTKCLGVPLKLVQGDASGGLYAGLFFPFRPARYDGKVVVGGDIQDITFDVNQMVAGAAPAGELPAAEPIDTAAPVPLFVAALEPPAVRVALLTSGALAMLLLLYSRQRRVRRPA